MLAAGHVLWCHAWGISEFARTPPSQHSPHMSVVLLPVLPPPLLLLPLQVLSPSRTVVAYAKAPEDGQHQRQQQPWEQASSSGGGGRFSSYIQSRESQQGAPASWRNGGSSNGASNGSNGASEGGGRFAKYISEREGGRGSGSGSSWGEQRQNGASQEGGSRFAKYYQR